MWLFLTFSPTFVSQSTHCHALINLPNIYKFQLCAKFSTCSKTFLPNMPCPLVPLTFSSPVLMPLTHFCPLFTLCFFSTDTIHIQQHLSREPLPLLSPMGYVLPIFCTPRFTLHHPLFLHHDTMSFLRSKSLCYLILPPLLLVECLEHDQRH